MVINPIDAQIMMLNQANIGKEQQQIKDAQTQMYQTGLEKLEQEVKEDQERVIKSQESEGQKIKDQQSNNAGQQSTKKKKKNIEQQKKDEAQQQLDQPKLTAIDPVRGRIIDIKL